MANSEGINVSLTVYLYIDVDTGGEELRRVYLFDKSITHNLSEMARQAGIYNELWRPRELDLKYAQALIVPLQRGLESLESNPIFYAKFNPQNGWGSYSGLVAFVSEYLEACMAHPRALIEISR